MTHRHALGQPRSGAARRIHRAAPPHYGYALYASYVPPIPHLSFTVSLEQAGSAVRYGEPSLYFFHRDQTELGLRLSASF